MLHKNLCVLLSLLLTICAVSAQNHSYQTFENIDLGSEASVGNCFLQDTQGMIWIGSDRGLLSYDGYSTRRHFTFGEPNNTWIHCGVVVDSTYLFLGSDNGLFIYNYLTDCYEETAHAFPKNIRALVQHHENVWIGTLNGLYIYNRKSEELTKVNERRLPHETIYSLLISEDQTVYIGTYNGLCRYLPGQDLFETLTIPLQSSKNNLFVNSLLEDKERGCIWIGTEGNLFSYYPATGVVEQIETFYDNSIKTLALDQNRNLIAGTDNGLYIYHESAPLRHIVHDSRQRKSLSNNIIWNIFTDQEKNIWFGTDYGISLLRFNSNFQYIPISQVTGVGDGNHFHVLFKDSRQAYWFGGTNGVIRFKEMDGGQPDAVWYKMGNRQNVLPHNRIRHIYEDKEQQLWLATDGSVNRYDRDSRKFVHYTIVDSTGIYNANWAYNLLEDDYGYLWIATCLGGIFIVNKEKLMRAPEGNYVAEYNLSTREGLSGMFVKQIVKDSAGYVWALYNNGVVGKIDIRTRESNPVTLNEAKGRRNISYILCDQSGGIWLGFRGGIIYTASGKIARTIHLGEFSDSEVISMVEVDGCIWVTTTDGIWVVNRETLDVERLNVTDKVFFSQYYDRQENRIYMGGVDGFAVISPELLNASTIDKPIVMTALFVNNQPMEFDEEITAESIRFTQSIRLNYRQNHLSFEFSDLPYSLGEKNKFVYRLEGIDAHWNLLETNSNRITYSNLSNGKYRLLVCKLDANGKASDRKYALSILITPPWYYTLWAKVLYLVLAVSLIAWIVNFFRVKARLKKERMEKERLIGQSQAKIDFFTEMSHDLTSPLSLIVAPVSKMLLELEDPAGKKQLEEVQHNALKFNELIHQKLREELETKSRLEQMTTPKAVEIVSVDEKMLTDITSMIEEHLADPDLNVNALCEWLDMSNKQLYRKIKQLTGATPVEYIKTIRMKKAAMLLAQKKLTVAEVMYRVGFSSHSYFSKCFQAEFGKTPRQFMEEGED